MTMKPTTFSILTAMLAAGAAFGGSDARELSLFRASEVRLMEMRSDLNLDSRHSFKAINTYQCSLNQDHTRLNQYFNGVRVWDAQVIDHVDPTRGELPITNDTLANIDLSVEPSLSQHEVLGLVDAARPTRNAYTIAPTVELVIYPKMVQVVKAGVKNPHPTNACDFEWIANDFKLAYHVHTESETASSLDHLDFMVDAHTGEILNQWDSLTTLGEKGKGLSQYNGEVEVITTKKGNKYEMTDPTRGGISVADMKCQSSGGSIYTDDDNNWGDGKNYSSGPTDSPNGQTAAVDAMYGLAASWDFVKNVINFNGINGKGKAPLARVHYKKDFDNANCNMGTYVLSFGDGKKIFRNLACVDVVGHEFGHGVCGSLVGWGGSGKGEVGGLSEGNSDIFGTVIEFYAKGGGMAQQSTTIPEQGGDWGMGYEIFLKEGKGLRYLDKPSKDGKNDDFYVPTIGNKDCHHSAGPLNRFFYFMSMGATTDEEKGAPKYLPQGMRGVGIDKAFRIWFRAMSTKCGKGANYAKAREGSIQAAQELYGKGSAEEVAVHNAWGAVNVGKIWSGSTPSEPPPTEPPSTEKLSIVNHPASQTATAGQILTFTVEAKGGKAPYKYNWYYNNELCPEYTTNTMSDECVKENHNAKIYVVVKDAAGASVKSQTATITIQ